MQKRALQRRGTLAGIQADNWVAALEAREPLLHLLQATHRERFAPRRRANQPPSECAPLPASVRKMSSQLASLRIELCKCGRYGQGRQDAMQDSVCAV